MKLRFALLLAALPACGSDDGPDLATEARPVVEHYADGVHDSYAAVVVKLGQLQTAVDAYVAAPSLGTLDAAKTAWVNAREVYRVTEVFRFYGGPIDDPNDEREPRINAWPMDEAYIDYVMGSPTAGIINDPTAFPTIDANVLATANLVGGDANIATGFHAIEFLLWGQDMNPSGPGARPATDYADGGTAANQARRRQYLQVVTQLLVDDMTHVAGRWDATSGDYVATFNGAPVESLTRILTGMGTLSAAELSGERMLTAYENKDQEDEHSCFSDTTRDDIRGNAQGLVNVYLGQFSGNDAPGGISALVAARDPELDARMKMQLMAVQVAVDAIPAPFDQAILGEDSSPGRMSILTAVRALQDVGRTTEDIAELLGVPVSTEL
jgi:putative iron-regulated protein